MTVAVGGFVSGGKGEIGSRGGEFGYGGEWHGVFVMLCDEMIELVVIDWTGLKIVSFRPSLSDQC